ncbi:putative catalase [Calycina marina]|uniref:Catalase n=1 Tax=Calycina marina TaxID=1763456 RepID=A0A9P7Z6W2_9HELO|nr:putative catalase [Calycina marina]
MSQANQEQCHSRHHLPMLPAFSKTTSEAAAVFSIAVLHSSLNPTYTLAEAYTTSALSLRQRCGGLERITERVVHASAVGAYVEFEVTQEIADKTPLLAQISTVGPEQGEADTARDPRGWVISFILNRGTMICDQGIMDFTPEEVARVIGTEPDHHNLRDLFEAIVGKDYPDYPDWAAYLQVTESKDAEIYRCNIFDMTKVWPHAHYALIPFGNMALNINIAMVPGIAPAPSMHVCKPPDSTRYRLGANYQPLPTNSAKSPVYSPFHRNGASTIFGNYGSDPSYVRSSLRHLNYGSASVLHDHEITNDDLVQPQGMWAVFRRYSGPQENFVKNVSGYLKLAATIIRKEAAGVFARVDG